jgi:hypothetical protein
MTGKALLVLGSKPDPALPPRAMIGAVACANGSGYSADQLGLPAPEFTLMTAVLASGIASGKQSLLVLAGLRTGELHFFPRPPAATRLGKQLMQPLTSLRSQPFYLKRQLRLLDYRFEHFVDHDYAFFQRMILILIDQDPDILRQMAIKQPSTGLMTIALALSSGNTTRSVIISGFSFELSHAYGHNPEIDQRGTAKSRHADTDIAILRYLGRKYPRLMTSEAIVSDNTGIPLVGTADAPTSKQPR